MKSLEQIWEENENKPVKVINEDGYRYILIGLSMGKSHNNIAVLEDIDDGDLQFWVHTEVSWQVYKEPKKPMVKYQALIKKKGFTQLEVTNTLYKDEEEVRRIIQSPEINFIKLLKDRPIECEVEDDNGK